MTKSTYWRENHAQFTNHTQKQGTKKYPQWFSPPVTLNQGTDSGAWPALWLRNRGSTGLLEA